MVYGNSMKNESSQLRKNELIYNFSCDSREVPKHTFPGKKSLVKVQIKSGYVKG